MRGKRLSLSSEIMGIEAPKKLTSRLDYDKIIRKQQEVIKILEKEIQHLRQYVLYIADFNEIPEEHSKDIEPSTQEDIHSAPETQNSSRNSSEPTPKKISGLKGIISEVMKMVEAKKPDQILTKLKEMYEKANRKIEPVFIERVKEKQVPITVVKEVQKEIIVEKIVEKIVEVPIFKQKIVQKYIDKPSLDDSFSKTTEHTFQQTMKKKPNYYEERSGGGQNSSKRFFKPRDDRNYGRNHKNHPQDSRLNKSTRYMEKTWQ